MKDKQLTIANGINFIKQTFICKLSCQRGNKINNTIYNNKLINLLGYTPITGGKHTSNKGKLWKVCVQTTSN